MSLQMGIRTRAQDTGDVDRALGEPVGGWEELRLPAVLKVSVEVPRGLCCHSLPFPGHRPKQATVGLVHRVHRGGVSTVSGPLVVSPSLTLVCMWAAKMRRALGKQVLGEGYAG